MGDLGKEDEVSPVCFMEDSLVACIKTLKKKDLKNMRIMFFDLICYPLTSMLS